MKSECERNQLRRFSDLFSIIGGGTPKTSVPEYWNGDIPWLSVKDFCGDRKFVYSAEKSITQLGLDNSSTKLLQAGDIIVSARGTVGELAMVGKTMAFNQSCFGLRTKEGIDEHYLYYLTQTKINELKKLSHGSVFDTITRETFEKVTCHVPPLPVQRKLASILSALDDKIETNNAICRNLEEQAETLFKSWFVDFEPFNYQRPSDWIKSDIYSLSEIIYGAPFSSSSFNLDKKGLPLIRIRDLKKQESEVFTEEVHPKAYVISPGDIVVGMDGEFTPYIWGGVAGLLNQRVCVFKNKRKKGTFFLFFSIKPQLEYIEQTEMATTVIHIGKKILTHLAHSFPLKKF